MVNHTILTGASRGGGRPPDVYICESSFLFNEDQFLGVALDKPHGPGRHTLTHTHSRTHLRPLPSLTPSISLLICWSSPDIFGTSLPLFLLSPHRLFYLHICCCFRLIVLQDVWSNTEPLESDALTLWCYLPWWQNNKVIILTTAASQISSLSACSFHTCQLHSLWTI